MSAQQSTILKRFSILIVCVITLMGAVFIAITYFSTRTYHEAGTQLLNKEVAAHIAKFASPFEGGGVNKAKADSVFYNAMVISPSAEVYFLDTSGKVIAYHAAKKEILEWHVGLPAILRYISSGGEEYIKGTDPRNPSDERIFSASRVIEDGKLIGYIYVIFGSKESESLASVLFGRHGLNLGILAFITITGLSVIICLVYLRGIRKEYRQTIGILSHFERGDFHARFPVSGNRELKPVAHAFNKMADLLSSSINRLKMSEQERKTFIATISHDLRTPLAIARGYAETLILNNNANTTPDSQADEYSKLIHSKILLLENRVSQLFELSRMDAVEFNPRFEPFVPAEIVQEQVNSFQLIAQERSVQLGCSECVQHVWIRGDIGMFERVVQNLVDNAVKNTSAGGLVEASITAEENALLFRITNEGIPLSSALLAWINESAEAGSVTAERPARLGLGLMIVKRILQLHQSHLEVESSQGKNVFSWRMPLYRLPG